MPRGGARINSGPPPDPNALRRDKPSDKDGWTTLPAEGRKGKAPKWPLPADVRLTSAIEIAETRSEMLGVQIEAGVAPRSAVAARAKLDQQIAELKARLRAAAGMEAELWRSLWGTPQAIVWQRLRWTREVALYVRWQVHAELGDVEAGKEARQWSDRLGLTPAALLRLRWKIPGEAPEKAKVLRAAPAGSAKDRLRVVHGGKTESA